MEDGQHGTVSSRVEELVRMPACGQRTGFRLTVAYHTANQQIGIVKCSSVGVCQRIAQLATFMDRPGSLRSDVAGNASWK